MDTYTKYWFVDILHSFPHINFSFDSVNSTFAPEQGSYRESIVFLSALPVVFVILVLLLASCCVCVHCTKKRPQKRTKTTCLRVIVALFIILSVGSVAVGFFANQQANKGIKLFASAVEDTNQTLEETQEVIENLRHLTISIGGKGLQDLEDVLNQHVLNTTILDHLTKLTQQIVQYANKTLSDINSVQDHVPNLNLSNLSDQTNRVEFIRWTATIVLLCFTLLLLIIATVGCYRKSRCFLVAATLLGFFSLLFIWVGSGFYLGVSVATADLCYSPDKFVESRGKTDLEKDAIKTFLECESNAAPDSISATIKEAVSAVALANNSLTEVVNKTAPLDIKDELEEPVRYLRQQLDYALDNITLLSTLLNCKNLHGDYNSAVNGLCRTGFIGIALLLLMMPSAGLFMTLMQCLLPRIWYLSGKRKGYRPVDDSDPFCPRPPPYNGYGSIHNSTGSPADFPSGVHHSVNDIQSNETLPMSGPLSESPPPAYESRRFRQTYSEYNPNNEARG